MVVGHKSRILDVQDDAGEEKARIMTKSVGIVVRLMESPSAMKTFTSDTTVMVRTYIIKI